MLNEKLRDADGALVIRFAIIFAMMFEMVFAIVESHATERSDGAFLATHMHLVCIGGA